MRKKLAPIIAVLLIVCIAIGVTFLTREPERCPLCEFIKSHAPCIVNVSTGEVVELALYQPHYTLVGELAEVQEDSTFSFVSAAGVSGYRISSPYRMELEIPNTKEPLLKTEFCKECRILLDGCRCGYVIADLYEHGKPIIYAIKDGLNTTFRCYNVAVSYNKDKELHDLVIKGTYHDLLMFVDVICSTV